MKKGEENKMQQYREETKTESTLVLFSDCRENTTLSEQKPRTSLMGLENRNAQT